MKIDSTELISELIKNVNSHLEYANSLKGISDEKLNWKSEPTSWSALECIEHLNLCSNFYVKEIKKRMEASSIPKSTFFTGNYIGNKFSGTMLPKDKMKKVKTFKKVNPIHSELNKKNVIGTFIHHQKQLLDILKLAEHKNLDKVKTSTLLPFLKLKLGNTLQLVIYHNERHLIQVKNVLA